MMKTIRFTHDALPVVAQELCTLTSRVSVFTLEGTMGAGKTTLVREMLQHLGITGPITSPTFTYVNAYTNDQNQSFYHFDLYRLDTTEDFYMMGFGEYLYQDESWAIIEWPEIVLSTIAEKACYCLLSLTDNPNERILQYTLSPDVTATASTE